MRSRPSFWIIVSLLCLAGAWYFWQAGNRWSAEKTAAQKRNVQPNFTTTYSSSTAPKILTSTNAAAEKTNQFFYRLSNTKKNIGELVNDPHAILLENALIDSSLPLNFSIPKKLQSPGDPGSYIVQARGPVDKAFRSMLAAAGAQIISYIPNNAFLVSASATVAAKIKSQPKTQAVIPYEPYYKVQPGLLKMVLKDQMLPLGSELKVAVSPNAADEATAALEKAGAKIAGRETSPFGEVLTLQNVSDVAAVARIASVQLIEPSRRRMRANDLSRAATGVAADSITTTNYLNLNGANVLVDVNDSGIDASHPDFGARVIGDSASSLIDINGHGTHVAGIIAGDGTESVTVTNAQGSIMPGTNGQFRGMAPMAKLYSVAAINNNFTLLNVSDEYLQEAPALTNALISNNSWNYDGEGTYDLAAASYDAAVRDALPKVTGSQPVLFVFSAGNDGSGNDNGGAGDPDTILSPATAKNVITVGALEEQRNITNIVADANGNSNAVWQPETDTSFQVAGFSSRGNVGIGTEGTFGRFKPDVVAPGTFVVSTRSQQWNEQLYYNPTNLTLDEFDNQIVQTNSLNNYNISVPENAVSVIITLVSNGLSRVPFPSNMPIYVRQADFPTPTVNDFATFNDRVSIPPDGGAGYLAQVQNDGFFYAVGDSLNIPINYDLITQIFTTNDAGNYFQVLSNLNDSIGTAPYYYRYESGTSMSAADVSGVLALMEDFFTNQFQPQIIPSPALLKALLINGARSTGNYNLHPANAINFEGWGLINLPNSIPPSLTNGVNSSSATNSSFFMDQSTANALATGDSHTFLVTALDATTVPLRVTLAWTDPPGNPAAAIKLVNNLDLVVSNLDDPANPIVYFGNDIPNSSVFNSPWNTNGPPNLDAVNNVENVYLPPGSGTNFSVTVVGRDVNVNAINATNNVAQDFALVISSGDGLNPGAITVTDPVGIVSNPTTDQQITFVNTTNTPLLNQMVGASPPLLGTNTVLNGTNQLVTVGMTNQWHFYVSVNTGTNANFTNAAFVTFLSDTLSLPRTGVFADSTADSTRPEADIDLYVSTDPTLTNLNPVVISNCLSGTQVGASLPGEIFNGASLSRSGTEYVVDTNSTPGQIYYIGVKSEDREAAEYGFLPVFTSTPFSQTDTNGNEIVNGVPLPVNIPDGSPAHPGSGYVFGLALQPIETERVIVTNQITHQNFGDLIGVLTHHGASGLAESVVLNNHDSLANPPGPYTLIYDDSGQGDVPNSQPSDGPGSLQTFVGGKGDGPWILTEVDDSLTQTGSVTGFNLFIEPHKDLSKGIHVTLQPGGFFQGFIDVPIGVTNLTIAATNTTLPPDMTAPLELFEQFNSQPTTNVFDKMAVLTNFPPFNPATYPGAVITVGPADIPPIQPGRYFVTLFNPSLSPQDAFIIATFSVSPVVGTVNFTTNGPPLPDDALASSTITITNTDLITSVNVGLVVNHPRVSDLTFTLISPTGQRILLMENRGGTTTNGLGNVFNTTNTFAPVFASGGAAPETNSFNVGETSGQITISYDMFSIPDEMVVYYSTNITPANLVFDTGLVSGANTITINFGPGSSTFVTIVMNPNGNTNGTTMWKYTAGGIQTHFNYLTFTEDTNLTTIPIKFAIPPYTLSDQGTNFILGDFELATNGDYFAPTNIFDANGGWNVTTNQTVFNSTNLVTLTNNEVSVVADISTAEGGSNYLALANGTISRAIPMTVGRIFSLSYLYRGPGIDGWWRGEGNATDSADPEAQGNNGELIGRFNFPAGEVGQAFQLEDAGAQFQFAGTNTYVQIRQSSSLDVGAHGGLTIEGWINPTNVSMQEPLVEWLAQMPTNGSDTNIIIEAGPFLNRETGHYYYLLNSTNWTTSESWATELGGHLATIDTANEENWVFDTFARYGGTNRNLWIGLTNSPANPGVFSWSSGQTNVFYTNWVASQPDNCGNNDFTVILNPTNANPGLWALADNNGNICTPLQSNAFYGVVEVDEIQPNGVQFWISVTNDLVSSNACLYADLVDTTNGSHIIFSAPGLVQTNAFQHIALTYNTNSGLAVLYYNGTNVASTNLGMFTPKTGGDILLGKDMSRETNNYFSGKMDEMSIYGRPLSASEIAAIYDVSAFTTNRNIGKFDPSVTPAEGLAEAQVSFGGTTNLLLGANHDWQLQSYSFTATTNSLPLQISGIEPGILLDSFSVSEAPLGNLYYLPEQSLDSLNGTSAAGAWKLEIMDNRTGANVTTNAGLVSWQLQFNFQTNTPIPTPLNPQEPSTITVPPGDIVYFSVDVPSWANFATNILVSSTAPVDVFFNQTNLPTGNVPPDYQIFSGSTAAVQNPPLSAIPPSTPPLLPGQTYYLGVRNPGAVTATVAFEVDFDILTLSNAVPVSSLLNTNDSERYFAFNVSSNATEATFQLLNLSGNADLVVRKGLPLPTLFSSDYGSFNGGNADENIYVLTNSSPVPLSAGTWYLGVIKRDTGRVNYTILAKELDSTSPPTIIDLTNGVPVDYTAGPGAALTNFFRFTVTNSPQSIRFELYDLTGNGDLTVETNAPPLAPPFFQSSQQPGLDAELVTIHTNTAQTNLNNIVLTNLNQQWYLGVPNHESNLITYTILAVIDTNSIFPAFPGAEGAGAGADGGGRLGNGGTVYHVTSLSDSGPGTLRDAVSSTNRTVVFDVSGNINLSSPLTITNSYLTIAGQTAPGGGITVSGWMTAVQSAHDVVIRDVRFRRGAIDDSLEFTNVANTIADHVSAEWSSDNDISALNSSNVTVQWSILSDSLFITNNPPPLGSLLRYGNGTLSFHHNLYADNYSGSPRLGDNISLDFVNNVIYNWRTNAGFSTNDSIDDDPPGFTNQLNYSCNYLIAGTNSVLTNVAFWGGSTNTWIFQTNNFIDSDKNGVLNGANTDWGMFTNLFTRFNNPFPLPPVVTDEAFIAYERVLDFAGVNLTQRDPVDTNIVTKVRTQTGTLISTPPLSGIVSWWKGEDNVDDSVGTNNGILQSGASFAPGEVGQAFLFNNTNAYVRVAASASLQNIGASSGLTIEGWIDVTNVIGLHPIAEFNDGVGDFGVQFWIGSNPTDNGLLYAALVDTSGNYHQLYSPQHTIVTNVFQHIAVTYDKASGIGTLYVNGIVVAQSTWASFIPQTGYDLWFGHRQGDVPGDWTYGSYLGGLLDELSIYKRALSANEIKSIYNAGSAGKFPTTAYVPPPLDSDQDGIPDYWEITLGENPTNADNNNPSINALGYTTLEEYINWLAAPHALDYTNTPVAVDLYKLAGNSGHLAFLLTNAVNGTVYLTNNVDTNGVVIISNSVAIFTPTINYSGYGSFDFYVTNTDTVAYFGPVTVSVMVSAVPVLSGGIITLTNMVPYAADNLDALGLGGRDSLDYYVYDVSTNAIGVKFQIFNASSNVVLFVRYGLPLPSPANFDYTTNASFGTTNTILILPSSVPVPLTNGNWYLAVSNASGGPVTYTIEATELLPNTNSPPVFSTNPPDQTNNELTTLIVTNNATDTNAGVTLTYTVTMSIDTNAMNLLGWTNSFANTTNTTPIIDTNGVITWTPSEAQGPGVYTITTVVADNGIPAQSATNSFNVTVNEVNSAPFWPTNVPSQTNYTISVLTPLVVTNMAMDSDLPVNPLTYTLLTPPTPAGATIDTNGIITWTPTLPGVYTFTTVVTDTNAYALTNQSLSATNSFTVTVFLAAAPFAFTQPAQSVTGTSAQLNGMATANGLPATAWFEWGTNTTYGNQTPPVNVGNSFNVVYTTNKISGLTPNVPYHFHLVVSNSLAVVDGFDQILDEANVMAWGANYAGQSTVPSGLSNVVAIAGAYDHSLALKNNGTAIGWGDNTFGQGTVPGSLNNNLTAVAGGEYYSMALKNSGTVVAWGANVFPGQTNVPVGLNNVVTIAGGSLSSLALKNDGSIVAWGANFSGLTNVPPGLSNVVAIAGGNFHSLAIKNDGTVMAWGDNSDGQTNVPPGLTNVVAIAGGSLHSLALKNNGTVVAWGDDSSGQTNVPAGLNNVVAIAAGGFHSLALKNDGSIVAWGDNSAGQISVPVGLTNAVAVSGGFLQSLALTPQFNVNPTNPIVLNITNGAPETNTVGAGGIIYYQVNVPTNADFATNSLLFALQGPLNVWFTTNSPPTTNAATVLIPNSTNGISVLSTVSTPTNIVPGAAYYLGVQNTNNFAVNYAVEVDFHLVTPPPIVISSITYTNNGITNGFLLTWFAPSNDLFQVQWNDNLASTNWGTFTNIVSYNTSAFTSPTNTQFNFFDDGSQTPPGLPPARFYRLILLQSTNPPPPTSTVPISGIAYTNNGITNGFLLTWFAPTNDLFKVQWSTNLLSTNWGTFTNIVAYDVLISPTNSQFNFFDDGSQTPPGLSLSRFYRLILLQATNSLTLPVQTNFIVSVSTAVNVTNTAADSRTGVVLTYSLTNSPAGANISTNGIITWTNATPAGLAARFATVVTDNGVPPLTATNAFTIFVAPLPSITNVTVTATNVFLQWPAPTNDLFQVRWTTNLTPVINWTLFPSIITSTNGIFLFTDTNAPLLMKFYQLVLLP